MNVPIIRYDEQRANDAYQVHAALLRAERDDLTLAGNPQWIMLKQDAFERFALAFEPERTRYDAPR